MSNTMLSRFDWKWANYWTAVFALNLPVPIVLAIILLGPSGLLGLLTGLAVLYWVGLILCGCRFRVGRSLVWGGAVIAATQFVPIIHSSCGAFGLGVWEAIGGQGLLRDEDFHGPEPGWRGDQNLAAFTVVIFTAHPLLVAAVILGALLRWYRGDTPIWWNNPANADPDA